jgi:hypothetical protein
MIVRTSVAAFLAGALGWVAAAPLPHYDLASLVVFSENVVLAQRGAERELTKYRFATTYRVVKVYYGSLKAGEEIELVGSSDASLWRSPFTGRAGPLDDTVVVFVFTKSAW